MDCCDHDPAIFFWKLLQNGLFIAIGCRGFLRLASKLEMQLTFVCQRRVPGDITKELAAEPLQRVLGIRSFPRRQCSLRIKEECRPQFGQFDLETASLSLY